MQGEITNIIIADLEPEHFRKAVGQFQRIDVFTSVIQPDLIQKSIVRFE